MNSLTVEYLPQWRFPGSVVFMGISLHFYSVVVENQKQLAVSTAQYATGK